MTFFNSSIKYFFKNFFVVLLFGLPAGIFFCLLLKPTTANFLKNLKVLSIKNFNDVFSQVLNFNYLHIIFSIVFLLILVFSFSMLSSVMEYHMRTGRLKLSRAFTGFKQYFLPTLFMFIILAIANFILMFLFSAISYFVLATTLSLEMGVTNVAYVIISLIYILFNIIFGIITAFSLSVILNMVINGSKFSDALSNSLHLFEGKFSELFGGYFLVLLISFALVFLFKNNIVLNLIIGLVTAILGSFIVVLNMISFFKQSKIERKDNIKSYF